MTKKSFVTTQTINGTKNLVDRLHCYLSSKQCVSFTGALELSKHATNNNGMIKKHRSPTKTAPISVLRNFTRLASNGGLYGDMLLYVTMAR